MRKLTVITALALALAVVGLAQDGTVTTRQFDVRASTSKEVPPLIGVWGRGTGSLEFIMTRDAGGLLIQAIIDWHADYEADEPEAIVAMHIHRGGEGTNGPVVINSGLRPTDADPTTYGTINLQVVITDPVTLAEVENVLAHPYGHYVNIHSASHPPGLIRGQLMVGVAESLANLSAVVNSNSQKLDDTSDQNTTIERFLREMANALGITIR
jgi:CHRD domain-containing protein